MLGTHRVVTVVLGVKRSGAALSGVTWGGMPTRSPALLLVLLRTIITNLTNTSIGCYYYKETFTQYLS